MIRAKVGRCLAAPNERQRDPAVTAAWHKLVLLALSPWRKAEKRCEGEALSVPKFRLIFFRASVLDRSETIEAPDALAAIHEAARRPSEGLVELWSECGKLATFRPAARHRFE